MSEAGNPARPDPSLLLRLESFLPYRLNVLADEVSVALARVYGERHGMSNAEWRILTTLGQFKRMTAKQVGAHSHMHKTKVSRAVASLLARQVIDKSTSQQDRRLTHLTLTDKGWRIYEDLAPRALDFAEGLLVDMSDDELAVLDQVLTGLLQRVRDHTPPSDHGANT